MKEIYIMQKISNLNHENLLVLLDFVVKENSLFIITEYCEGGSLHDQAISK